MNKLEKISFITKKLDLFFELDDLDRKKDTLYKTEDWHIDSVYDYLSDAKIMPCFDGKYSPTRYLRPENTLIKENKIEEYMSYLIGLYINSFDLLLGEIIDNILNPKRYEILDAFIEKIPNLQESYCKVKNCYILTEINSRNLDYTKKFKELKLIPEEY